MLDGLACLGMAAASAQPLEFGAQVGALGRPAASAHRPRWRRATSSPPATGRIYVLRRIRDAPGGRPPSSARRAESPKRPMSTPISAMMHSAARRSTPVMVSSSSISAAKGPSAGRSRREVLDRLVQKVELGQDLFHDEPMVGDEAARRCPAQHGILRAACAGKLGGNLRVMRGHARWSGVRVRSIA